MLSALSKSVLLAVAVFAVAANADAIWELCPDETCDNAAIKVPMGECSDLSVHGGFTYIYDQDGGEARLRCWANSSNAPDCSGDPLLTYHCPLDTCVNANADCTYQGDASLNPQVAEGVKYKFLS